MRLLGQFQTFYFFFTKRFHKYKKAENHLQRTKLKKYVQKTSKGKNSLIHLFAFCAFDGCVFMLLVLLVLLVLLMFLVHPKSFCKNKEFKRFQETSFCVIKTI